MKYRKQLVGAGLIGLGMVVSGCASQQIKGWNAITDAVAVIRPTQGNTCHGIVRFTKVHNGVQIVANVEGLAPGSTHAFHVHQFGDATSPDGKSAGGHYNPEGMPHGRPSDARRHAGDLGNIVADGTGRASYARVDHHLTISGPKNAVIGRGVIVHAGPDTWVQPTGAAGARIGIGVIGIARKPKP